MKANIFTRRLQSGLFEGFSKHVIENVGVRKRTIRRLATNEQGTRIARPSVLNIINDGFTHIVWKRHAIKQLPLPTDQDFTGAPVNIFKLNRYHFWSTKTQSCRKQQHRIVTSANRIACLYRIEQSLDLLRMKETR